MMIRAAPVQVKNARQVHLEDSAVKEVPEAGRRQRGQQRAEQRDGGFAGGLGCGPQEQGRLQALPAHRQRRHDDQAPGRPSAALSTWPRRSPPRCRAVRAIQNTIQVTSPTATMDRLPPIASWASNVRPRGPKVSSAPKPREMSDGEADAGPDAGDQVPPAGLVEVCQQEDHDQRCLEAFAQADQEIGGHSLALSDDGTKLRLT